MPTMPLKGLLSASLAPPEKRTRRGVEALAEAAESGAADVFGAVSWATADNPTDRNEAIKQQK